MTDRNASVSPAYTAEQIIEGMARAFDPTAQGAHERCVRTGEPNEVSLAVRWMTSRQQARTAYAECLRMLREPPFGQVSSGGHSIWEHASPAKHELVTHAWRAMIDDRIKELG